MNGLVSGNHNFSASASVLQIKYFHGTGLFRHWADLRSRIIDISWSAIVWGMVGGT